VISSLYAHLPQASMLTFRVALGFGVVVVLALGLGHLYPLAVVAAAVLVPLLTILYLVDVDIYEDEPVSVMAFTMLWGIAAGIGVGLLAKAIEPAGANVFTQSTSTRAILRGVFIPLVSTVLMMAGPLALLPYRKFNDVLDGATFGASAAVTFAGAAVITQSFSFFSQGLHPSGTLAFWMIRLLELAVAAPILAAGAIGAAVGAFWLRYRAPVRDRDALGLLGHPVTATAIAAALLVGGALLQVYLVPGLALALMLVLDGVALVWLRLVLHVGLLEEAAELDIGPEIVCANCGRPTPRHTFCIHCGISLKALPKGPRRAAPAPAGPPGEVTT